MEGFPQVPDSEYGEYHQGDDLLRDLELEAREAVGITQPVCGHHQAVFEESDAPGDEDGLPERHAGILQVAVPGKGHEDVGSGKKKDRAEHVIKNVECCMLYVEWVFPSRKEKWFTKM